MITTPKTKKSIRTIKMPKFLCEEMQEYIQSLYGVKKKNRIFRSQRIISITKWIGAAVRPGSNEFACMISVTGMYRC